MVGCFERHYSVDYYKRRQRLESINLLLSLVLHTQKTKQIKPLKDKQRVCGALFYLRETPAKSRIKSEHVRRYCR